MLQDVDGNAPVSLGSGGCATEEEGVNMFQPCSGTTKSINDALCQTINLQTLKPTEGGSMDAYESYICCAGCTSVGMIVGIAVACLVVVGVGVCVLKSKRAKSPGGRVTVVPAQPQHTMVSAPPPMVPMAAMAPQPIVAMAPQPVASAPPMVVMSGH